MHPANAEHKTEAELYINFLCDPEIAAANMDYVGYATPESAAKEYLSPEVVENPIFYRMRRCSKTPRCS